jgi:glycosyltransferase involved in cell wall biosynthesis
VNILCLDQYSNLGGGQRNLIDLLPAFSERGWNASIAAPGDGPLQETVRKMGYRTHRLFLEDYSSIRKPPTQMLRFAWRLPQLARAILNVIKDHKVDLLYVNGARMLPATSWAARRSGVPLVFHAHSRLLQQSAIFLSGQALKYSHGRVIACCEHVAAPLKKYVPSGKLTIVYNGADGIDRVTAESSDKARRIGVIGRIEPEKGQLQFVQAARSVFNKFPDCRFSVIGAPMFSSGDYLKRVQAASAGLPINFFGWQDNIAAVFSKLDLLVVPSTPLEATTRVIFEAYSAGVPVVAFPSGGIPEILSDNETGFLATAITVEALAQRIISVLRMDEASVNRVVQNARRTWAARYTLAHYRANVCAVVALEDSEKGPA